MNDLGNEIMADAIYEKILPFIFNTPEQSYQMTVKTNMDWFKMGNYLVKK